MHEIFLGIQGQESALNLLTEIYTKKRIPNALLFSGTEGIGKFFSAIQFLKLLNSQSDSTSLKKITNLSEPYIKYIIPLPRGKNETNSDTPTSKLSQDVLDEVNQQIKLKSENPYHKIDIRKANNIKINSIREINKIVSLNFDEIAYRGIILSDAHKMTTEAQNAFLKNLEEPPEGIIYILITDNPDLLLTTIKSRCWEVNFSPLREEYLSSILRDKFNFTSDDFSYILPFANGSVTNAIFLKENNTKDLLHKTILILRYSLAKKYFTAITEFNSIIENNSVSSFQMIIDLIISWLNDTLKQKHGILNISFQEYSETLEKFNLRYGKTKIYRLISKLIEYRNAPNRNVSLNLLALNVIFELSSIEMN